MARVSMDVPRFVDMSKERHVVALVRVGDAVLTYNPDGLVMAARFRRAGLEVVGAEMAIVGDPWWLRAWKWFWSAAAVWAAGAVGTVIGAVVATMTVLALYGVPCLP